MIAVYAMGGGLGHLARARRVLHALGCAPKEAVILSASPLACGPDIVPAPRRLAHARTEFAAWLKKTLRALAPSKVVVDAFPLGILGELADPRVLPDVLAYHVARILKWDAYRDAFSGTPRKYEASFIVEEVGGPHREFLAENSNRVASLDLSPDPQSRTENPFKGSTWLIVHGGPAAEVRALIEFAVMKSKKIRSPVCRRIAARTRPTGRRDAHRAPARVGAVPSCRADRHRLRLQFDGGSRAMARQAPLPAPRAPLR